jgi:uncharacterized damage-inducible protein DinB
MATQLQIWTLFSYHWHTTQQLLDFATQLSNEEYFSKTDDWDSFHQIFFHLLRANQGWRGALETGTQQKPLNKKDFSDLAVLKVGFEAEKAAWDSYLEKLRVSELQEPVILRRSSGEERTFILWRVLHHLVIHGMQHHSEIAHRLTNFGYSPGNIDFIFFQD